MNVFWLLSSVVLWNVVCDVDGRVSSSMEDGECDDSDKSVSNFLNITEKFEIGSTTRTYRVVEMIEITYCLLRIEIFSIFLLLFFFFFVCFTYC